MSDFTGQAAATNPRKATHYFEEDYTFLFVNPPTHYWTSHMIEYY
jgi:hypothetical protein